MAEPKLVSKDDIPVGVGSDTPETTKRWVRQQVPYQNFAGHPELDLKVRTFVDTIRSQFRQRMMGVYQRWAWNWATANGEAPSQEREDDVAMPETQKLLNAKVAHMENALFSSDPILEAEGVREDLGALRQVVISSYIRRMLELCEYRDYFGPAARDAQLCNYSAIKVVWQKRWAQIIETSSELKYEGRDKPPVWHIEKRASQRLVEDGPRLHLVDPFWLLIDLDAGHWRDLAYIGDESDQFLHELEAAAELGILSKTQVAKLRKQRVSTKKGGDANPPEDLVEHFRNSRQIAMQSAGLQNNTEPSVQIASRVHCIELWAWFDFGDGFEGVTDPTGNLVRGTHQVVITVAGNEVVQFRLNPFDKKFFPYAVAVMNRNGHEMVAPAPFDQVTVMNAQYDRFQSRVLRHMHLSMAPQIAAGEDADISDPSITEYEPGGILRGLGRDWKEIQIKDLPQSSQFFYGFYRREMEELSGKLRVHETTPGSATEVERKLQEQVMLLDRETRIQAAQWKQVCLIIYRMAGQFATQAQQFAVVGKAQALLGKTFTVPPNWLQEDIDIRFLGLESIHTLGQRSAAITQWMNQWGPMLPQMPSVNLEGLARLQWQLMVGPHNMMQVFPEDEPAWMAWQPEEEDALLRQGLSVPVSKRDDDEQHLQRHVAQMRKLAQNRSTPTAVLDAYAKHVQDHIDQLARKRAEEYERQRQARQQGQMMQLAGGQPGVDGPAAGGGMEPRTKESGITNGPPQARTVARGGREGAGISQTQAMGAG